MKGQERRLLEKNARPDAVAGRPAHHREVLDVPVAYLLAEVQHDAVVNEAPDGGRRRAQARPEDGVIAKQRTFRL